MFSNNKLRIDELQHLRGIAFLAVVIQHAVGMFSRTPGYSLSDIIVFSIVFNLAKFAVPMFVFISGIVMFYNYFEKLHYPSFLAKRIKELIIPYFIFTLFYYYYWAWDKDSHFANDFPGIFLSGDGYYHLWFVVMIFQFYLLFPLFRWLFQAVRTKSFNPMAAGVIIAVLLAVFIGTTYAIFNYGTQLKSDIFGIRGMLHNLDRTVFSWYFYFIFGGILAFSIAKWKNWLKASLFWNLPLFLIGLLWVTYELGTGILPNAKFPQELPIYLGVSTSFKASMILFTVSSIMIWYHVSVSMAQRKNWLSNSFRLMGQYSFGAYLFHAAALDITHEYLKTATMLPNSLQMAVAVVVTAAASVLLTFLLSRLPFGHFVVGATRRKPASGRPSKTATPAP